ncbi:nitrogenase component 1, partial [Paenibacillus forsythiae]
MNEIRQRLPRTREKRRGALTAYFGDCAALADELEKEDPRQRIRTYSETGDDEVIGAIRLLGRIRSSVTIIHSPPGCGAVKLEDELKEGGSPWLITNIEENDSILGADDKLREAVDLAYRTWRPEIIFILATPVVAINNDDILSAATEKGDLYNIPVVPVFAAGFRSRTAAYGYDLVFHALAKYVLREEPGALPIPAVNLIGAAGTRTDHVIKDLNGAGVSYNNVSGSLSISALQQSLSGSASIAIDKDDARYLLEWLEEAHGVVHLEETAPIGLTGTERWLLAAAGAGGSTGQAR